MIRIKYKKSNNTIIFEKKFSDSFQHWYEVDMDEPNTLERWISHLKGKNWMTKKLLKEFIDLYERNLI